MSDGYVSSPDWANLPKNLLDSIVERLSSLSDYARFSVVCMSWFGVAKHNLGHFAKKMLSHPEPPMFLFFNNNEAAWNLYNMVDYKVLDVQLKMPNRRFCGSSRGWLVHVEKDFTVTLTKPVFYKSNKRGKREDVVVRLPELNPPSLRRLYKFWVKRYESFVRKAIITADPVLDADDSIVVLTYTKRYHVAFIRPSKDTTWTYLSTDGLDAVDVLHYGGDKFYAVQNSGNLLTFAISSNSNSVADSLQCQLPTNESTRDSYQKYLVNYGKNLLMVDKGYGREGDANRGLNFRVYEFNFDKCNWIEKITLCEEVALFLGNHRLIFVAASNFPGCRQNCVYYERGSLTNFGMYDMETKKFSESCSKQLMALLSLTKQSRIWFTPSIHL